MLVAIPSGVIVPNGFMFISAEAGATPGDVAGLILSSVWDTPAGRRYTSDIVTPECLTSQLYWANMVEQLMWHCDLHTPSNLGTNRGTPEPRNPPK